MPESPDAWQDALLAARLLKAGGPALGGLWLKARAGGVRDAYLDHLKSSLCSTRSWTRVPSSVSHSALVGSIDIPATARTGRVVVLPGLLARADGSVLLLPMAERMEAATAALIGNALEIGRVRSRTGSANRDVLTESRFQVIAIDESASDEERVPAALADRLGLIVDLSTISWSQVQLPDAVSHNPTHWRAVEIGDQLMGLLSGIACAAGRPSLRTLRHLATVTRLLSALEDRATAEESDAVTALRLCLGLRLEVQPPEADEPQPEDTQQPDGNQDQGEAQEPENNPHDLDTLTELLAAVEAGTIAGLPDFSGGTTRNKTSVRSGKAGTPCKAARRGRPVSVSRSAPFPDARPNIIATLRAAAPWQLIRSQNRAVLLSQLAERDKGRANGRSRIRYAQPKALITRDDYRYQRLRHETPSTAIFMVDASGSTALERLGETKGAIEQLLARSYVRRDEVAMIAFRGRGAETILAPTRSLVMAKRKLAGLPGGGPTPLVSGLEKGLELGLAVRRQGSTPVMVLLTDGRGNIALNGEPDRARAREELDLVAGKYRSFEMRSICIDIARRPRETVASLAETMGADLHVLRHADASAMSDVVDASLQEARG